jgi:hypothetical protein
MSGFGASVLGYAHPEVDRAAELQTKVCLSFFDHSFRAPKRLLPRFKFPFAFLLLGYKFVTYMSGLQLASLPPTLDCRTHFFFLVCNMHERSDSYDNGEPHRPRAPRPRSAG